MFDNKLGNINESISEFRDNSELTDNILLYDSREKAC